MTMYNQLSEALPEEGIERSDGKKTRKGYDTTGYGYQYVVDRFNAVCGIGGWKYQYEIIHEERGEWGNGKPYYEITCNVTISVKVDDGWHDISCAGGHQSGLHADALKGAITNGFKKTAAFFGVGAEAYRGTIDDDNQPQDSGPSRKPTKKRTKTEFNGRDTVIPWGKHQGEKLRDIPANYLQYIAENANTEQWKKAAQEELDERQMNQVAREENHINANQDIAESKSG